MSRKDEGLVKGTRILRPRKRRAVGHIDDDGPELARIPLETSAEALPHDSPTPTLVRATLNNALPRRCLWLLEGRSDDEQKGCKSEGDTGNG